MTRRWSTVLYPASVIVALLLAWYLWVTVGDTPEYVWPPLGEALEETVTNSELRRAALDTILLIAAGFGLALAVGLLLAMLTITFRPFEVAVLPLIVSTQFMPLVAFAPLFVIWFGFGMVPKLVIVTLFGYFPIMITTLTGLRAVQPEKLYLARTMGASTMATFWKIRFPGALPSMFSGMKIAMTSCVIGAVIAEFVVGSSGVGYVILQAQGVGDSVVLVAGVIWLAVIGAASFLLVALAERLAVPWHASQRNGGGRSEA